MKTVERAVLVIAIGGAFWLAFTTAWHMGYANAATDLDTARSDARYYRDVCYEGRA